MYDGTWAKDGDAMCIALVVSGFLNTDGWIILLMFFVVCQGVSIYVDALQPVHG